MERIDFDRVDICSPVFHRAVAEAGNLARLRTLAAGVPVFYRQSITRKDVMEQPDGRIFEIRFIPNAPRDENYEIIGELAPSAA